MRSPLEKECPPPIKLEGPKPGPMSSVVQSMPSALRLKHSSSSRRGTTISASRPIMEKERVIPPVEGTLENGRSGREEVRFDGLGRKKPGIERPGRHEPQTRGQGTRSRVARSHAGDNRKASNHARDCARNRRKSKGTHKRPLEKLPEPIRATA